jgi:glutathione S-transferase
MKLHYFPLSTYSQKALIALYEKGTDFTLEMVDFLSAEGRAAYKKIYPLGKVPLLVRDDGWIVPESTIIVEYIEQHHQGGTKLIPADPELARRTRFMDRMFDLYVNDPFQVIFFDARKPEAERSPTAVAAARERLDVMYEFLDKHLAKCGPWAVGEAFTMADCAAAPALTGARMVHPFDKHQNLMSYFGRLTERPSFARVLTETKPYVARLMG